MSQGAGEEMLREKENKPQILTKKSWSYWLRPEVRALLGDAPPSHPVLRSRREAPSHSQATPTSLACALGR